MGKVVKVDTELAVNPDYVVCVRVFYSYNTVVITMEGGVEHTLKSDHGRSVWQTYDRIIAALGGEVE